MSNQEPLEARLLAAYHGLMVHHEAARDALESIDAALEVKVPLVLVDHTAEAVTKLHAARKLIATAVTLAEPAVEIAGTK